MKKKFYLLLALSLQGIAFAQKPMISYTSPQSYLTGTAITPLAPINAGGSITYGKVTTLAGHQDSGSNDGTGTAAGFYGPRGIALDAQENIYVADFSNNKIRKVTPAGVVTTFAGSGAVGAANGTGVNASFNGPSGVAVDASGNVYVADSGNNIIRKITPQGVVGTLASGTTEGFNLPSGVAVDASGNVIVADTEHNKIKKITPSGEVITIAGSGTAGSDDGAGTAASFHLPIAVAVDGQGNVYVADDLNNKIRMISTGGVVSTFAGGGTQGSADGIGTAASFYETYGVVFDPSGNLLVVDLGNNKIRKITPEGVVSTLAGSGFSNGSVDGVGTAASFLYPMGIAAGASGNVYVADYYGNDIRKIDAVGGFTVTPQLPGGLSIDTSTGIISGTPTAVLPQTTYTITATNLSGTSITTVDITVNAVPDATDTCFNHPSGITMDSSGNFYVGDTGNKKIKKITPTGEVTTFAGGGTVFNGSWDGTGTNAFFLVPTMVAVAHQGNVYVLDTRTNAQYHPSAVREITSVGGVTTLLWAPYTYNEDIPTEITAVAGDVLGNLYVDYTQNNSGGYFHSTLVKITPEGVTTTVSTDSPYGIADIAAMAVDAQGNIYRTDVNVITKITSSGVVTTLAGGIYAGFADGLGTAASFNKPAGVAVDAQGNVYISDTGNNKIRKITPAGVVTTLAGNGSAGKVDGIGTTASFNSPMGMTIDASSNLYVADQQNNLIRKITPTGVVSTFAGATCALAVEDVIFKNMVIYPNPTKEEVNIANVLVEKVSVYNNAGQLVETVINSESANTTTVQLNNLPTGIYYLNIEAENDCVVKQIIKE